MRETWYVLEDGRSVDPNEVAPNEAGALIHSSGVAVAMRSPGVPHSRGVDVNAERAKAEADAKAKADLDAREKPRADAKEMKPSGDQKTYKTRESKSN